MQFISAVRFVLVLLTSAVHFWRTGHPVHDVHLGGPPSPWLLHSSCRFLLYSVSLRRFGSSPFGSLISPLCAIAWGLFPFSPHVLSHKGWSPGDLVPCSPSAPVSASDSGSSVASKCYCGRSLLGLLTACTQFLTLIPSLEWGWELSFGLLSPLFFSSHELCTLSPRELEKLPWLHVACKVQPSLDVLTSTILPFISSAYPHHSPRELFVVSGAFLFQSPDSLDPHPPSFLCSFCQPPTITGHCTTAQGFPLPGNLQWSFWGTFMLTWFLPQCLTCTYPFPLFQHFLNAAFRFA